MIPHEDDVTAHYGEPKLNIVYAQIPYELIIAWNHTQRITRFPCHKMVKDNIETIFKETLRVYGLEEIQRLHLDKFGGCYNYRKKRGGSKLSMHSWGIAVDLAPKVNQLRWGSNRAHFARPEYKRFWEIVERAEGVSLGRQWDFDWMHFQFAKV